MDFPVTIESQDAFDEVVKERIARERAKFSDYDTLKASLAQAEAARTEAEQARDAAIAKEAETSTKLAELDQKAQAAWKSEVSKATGVPAEALAGSTKEEFEAHAAILKRLMTPQTPVIPTQGQEPEAHGTSDERAFVRGLFGGDE